MSDAEARIMAAEIGGKTVGDRLMAALAGGGIERKNGTLSLGRVRKKSFITKLGIRPGEFGRKCKFLNDFLFQQIYGETTVPWGCRDCFKVKVSTHSVRQFMAVKGLSEGFPYFVKSGVELASPQQRYATYIYTRGLEQARTVYKALRAQLGSLGEPTMLIKRGCTNYERKCGPSDRYTFDPRLSEIEDYFHERFTPPPPRQEIENGFALLDLLKTASRIGDDTYKDFTDGKALKYDGNETLNYRARQPVITYASEDSQGRLETSGAG